MEYRYQETLSWIIPGFYFLFLLSIETLCIFPSWELSTNILELFNTHTSEETNISDGLVTLMVFAIPIFSFIVGWIINGYAGYIFRYVMKWPTTKAYNDIYSKNENGCEIKNYKFANNTQAEEEFDIARRVIDLENVDRFYYRYVASRNLYIAQYTITILSIIAIIIALFDKTSIVSRSIIFTSISILVTILFYFIVARDLNTHARYVFVRYRNIMNDNNK